LTVVPGLIAVNAGARICRSLGSRAGKGDQDEPPMKTSWIVVADASRARVFSRTGRSALTEVATLVHPASRLHARDLGTDAPGRQSGHGGRRHQVEPRNDPKEVETIAFAREIAKRVTAARVADEFDELVLIAPPHFLGDLRQMLDDPTRGRIAWTSSKDLAQADPATIEAELERAD
jgi:protein required for attachment to host cells